jgi:DNA/RNA-binding domain of Phe-tRNA-synthetase-like protein
MITGQNITISKKSVLVDSEIKDLINFIRNKFASMPVSSDEIISSVRRMYRRIGWEPTRYRPASEALIRRILKDIGLYNINNLVDLGNIVSTRYHLPLGLYDRDKIKGHVIVDVGKQGESYEGLSIPEIHAGGKLILRDDSGIFGNPSADSKRTCIDTRTEKILGIFFTPPEITHKYLQNTLLDLVELYKKECPNSSIHSTIIEAH